MSLLERFLPQPDAVRREALVINAPLPTAYQAAVTTDFLDAVRGDGMVRALFAVRSYAQRALALATRRAFTEPPAPETLRLLDLGRRGEWVRLGSTPVEFAFGAIGRFWAGETSWLVIDSAGFEPFALPGYAKIACHLEVASDGPGRTKLVYEARTAATDAESRRAFRRYWFLVTPFVGYIMRATLRAIARNAITRAMPVPAVA
jgi:hypothetical protein